MMLATQCALLLGLLLICCFLPGFFFIRWLRWTAMEKLCGSIGLSLIILYLVTWFVYLCGSGTTGARMPVGPLAATSIVCIILGTVARCDILRLLRSSRVRQSLLGYGFLLVWTLALLSVIRVYSAASWYGDWLEHFQRALFFFWHFPTNTELGNMYLLPARPPLMNVVAAYFLGLTEDRFELFQIIFTFLNLLVFLPCCLILPAIGGRRRTYLLPLVALLALNPVVMQNATYSWTKSLAAFFVVLGIAYYLAAWRKRDHPRMVAAFVSLAAGSLVHYSAGPYLVFLLFHYFLCLFWKRPGKWREIAIIFVFSALLLTTWFGWSFRVYGKATFLSNTTVALSETYEGNNLTKALDNTYDSIMPALFRDHSLLDRFQQPDPIVTVREKAFLFYQPNMIFGMGLIGGPAVLYLLWTRFRRALRPGQGEVKFWIGLTLFCAMVGCGVVGERDELGVAHLTLFSLEILGLTLLASEMPRSRWLAGAAVAGCLLDFSFGVFLHTQVQGLENDSKRVVFRDVEFFNSTVGVPAAGPHELCKGTWKNWSAKHRYALFERWLEELPRQNANDEQFQAQWPDIRDAFQRQQKHYETNWGGWYSRHDGQTAYLGDHIANWFGQTPSAVISLALLAGLVAALSMHLRSIPLVPLTKKQAAAGDPEAAKVDLLATEWHPDGDGKVGKTRFEASAIKEGR